MSDGRQHVLVTGAGGFIGHHLVGRLKGEGHWVRGVDIKEPEFEPTRADEFRVVDLRRREAAYWAAEGVDRVYHLAADMGGIGYITGTHASITRNNALININALDAARAAGVRRFLFSSSACVYPQYKQKEADADALEEDDAWPADPEEGYGLEKLFMEKLCQYYREDFGFETRAVRFHNVYGPLGVYEGGKEKAPAALCRKVALARDGGSIEVWGDGEQTRSFMYIDDCLKGLIRIMEGDHAEPLNLGRDEMVTINEFVDLICDVAGKNLSKDHDLSKPQGVRGRNSDNSRLREVLGWEPQVDLREGITRTYRWIWQELDQEGRARPPSPAAKGDGQPVAEARRAGTG